MTDFLTRLPEAASWIIWLVSSIALVIASVIQWYLGRRLFYSTATMGIVSLELAGYSAHAQAIIDSWDPAARRNAIRSVRWYFGLIASYVLFLSYACAWASGLAVSLWDWDRRLGFAMIALAWITGAFDILENIALLRMLQFGVSKFWTGLASRSAFVKFTVFTVVVAFVAAGVVAWSPILSTVIKYASSHLGFVLILVLVYGIVFGMLGTDNGIPSLYWHDDPLVRISASCAVTLLLLDLGVISFYEVRDHSGGLVAAVAGRQPWVGNPDRTFEVGPDGIKMYAIFPVENARYLGKFLSIAAWPPLLLLAAPALFPWLFPKVPRIPLKIQEKSQADRRWRWLGAVAWLAGIALGIAIARFLLWLGPWFHVLIVGDKPSNLRTSVVVFYLVFLLVYVAMANGPLYRIVSPAVAVSALLAIVAMTYAMVTYFDGHFFPFMKDWWIPPRILLMGGLLALFGWANNGAYKLRFPNMEMYYPDGTNGLVSLRKVVSDTYQANSVPPLPPDGAVLIDDRTTLEAWLSKFPTDIGVDKPKLVVISVSGGATRSAYWVATVLDRLEKEIPGFSDHVRIITGASGGMVGTAFYVKELKDRIDHPGRLPQKIRDLIPWDSINPVARFIALRELWRSFLPIRFGIDRGIVLEEDWGATRKCPREHRIRFPIQDLKRQEAGGLIPSLIFSPMMVDDGRRLLISNLDLWNLSGARGGLVTEDDPGSRPHDYSLSAFEFFRLFPKAKDFEVATAVRMNASFPFVSPAVNLPTDPPRRVVDAGYYDNYGVQVSSAWLQKNTDWLVEHTSGVVMIQIRDAISQKERLEVADAPSGAFAAIARGFQFLTSPLDAAGKARYSVSAFQNDQAVENLSNLFTDRIIRKIALPPNDPDAAKLAEESARSFFTTVVFENSAEIVYGHRDPNSWPGENPKGIKPANEVALDWYLSQAEREGLDTAIPTPQGHWAIEAGDRLEQIDRLRELVALTHGTERDRWLNELEQARNFERIVQLKAWWT